MVLPQAYASALTTKPPRHLSGQDPTRVIKPPKTGKTSGDWEDQWRLGRPVETLETGGVETVETLETGEDSWRLGVTLETG